MKILVVEDDAELAAYVSKGLHESGFVIDVAESGEDGLLLARSGDYDLVLLDIGLPERDGWSVLKELRRGGKQTPVLCLTARDGVPDRVKGLELGADDYLVKPFAFSELLARVRSVLRRGPARTEEVLRVDDLEIDLVRHRAARSGRKLDLTPKEFALLSLLARRVGEPLSRTIIAEQVWDMNFDSDTNVIDVHMRRLRAKVDDPFPRKLIQTVRGIGYMMDVPGQGEEEPEDDAAPAGMTAIAARLRQSVGLRLASIEAAAAASRRRQMTLDVRQQAEREAHKLAGSLGTLGFPAESRLAREIEKLLESGEQGPELAGRLQDVLARLRAGLDAPGAVS